MIDNWKPNILGEVGELREAASGRSVKVLSSQPSVMIYTGNWLAGGCPETKTGGRYADYDGVAIECQNYPRRREPPRIPLAAAAEARRTLLSEDRVPLRNVLKKSGGPEGPPLRFFFRLRNELRGPCQCSVNVGADILPPSRE